MRMSKGKFTSVGQTNPQANKEIVMKVIYLYL